MTWWTNVTNTNTTKPPARQWKRYPPSNSDSQKTWALTTNFFRALTPSPGRMNTWEAGRLVMEAGGRHITPSSDWFNMTQHLYHQDHFPDLISHFPYHWLHYIIFINIILRISETAYNYHIWRALNDLTFRLRPVWNQTINFYVFFVINEIEGDKFKEC